MLALLVCAASGKVQAQDKHEYTDLFLTNKQGDLCTMCEADVSCAPALVATESQVEGTEPPKPEPTVLHFYKRGFLGQMSTVLDYFPPTRKFGLYHSRDVDVKAPGDAVPQRMSAKLDLANKRIDVTNAAGQAVFWIDRNTGAWNGPDNAARGQCVVNKM
ncbi:MAG: hypothetical protein JNM81_09105 [Rhodospirillaceae bacterium]|nr:hypothetical protein [Rhodospirillaceae bacterium]